MHVRENLKYFFSHFLFIHSPVYNGSALWFNVLFFFMTNSAIIFSDVNQPFVQTGMEFVKSISIAQKKIPLWFAVFPNSPSHKPKQSKKSKMKSNPECVFFWPSHIIGLYFTNELIWKFLCCDWPVWNPLTCYYQIWGWTAISAFTRRDARMLVSISFWHSALVPLIATQTWAYTHIWLELNAVLELFMV